MTVKTYPFEILVWAAFFGLFVVCLTVGYVAVWIASALAHVLLPVARRTPVARRWVA